MPDLPLLDTHKPRCGPVAHSKRGLYRALVLIAVHVAIVIHIAQWKWSGKTVSAVEPSEAATTLELGVVNAGFVLFLLLIASTLVFGRFFCGWACHVVAYQDLCAWLLTKTGFRPRPVRSRLLVFVPLWVALDMFVLPSLPWTISLLPYPSITHVAKALPAFQGFELTTDDLWERFPSLGISLLTFAVDGFLLVWWFGAKGFCTYGCPYGAIFGVADRVAPGKIRVTDACEGCGHCTAVCTSNVRVHDEVRRFGAVVDPGCMKCMDCVNVCPKDALYYGFGKPAAAMKRGKSTPAKVYDFTWREELTMAAIFCVSIFAFRGLYDRIPFLLAIGLAVMASISGVALARLVSKPNFLFQHFQLKTGGKLSTAGFVAAAVFSLYILLTAHSTFVQVHMRLGESWMRVASMAAPNSPERPEARDAAARHFETAEAFGLVKSGKLEFDLASVAFNRGNTPEAERRLRAAVDVNPRHGSAWLLLAELRLRAGDVNGAEALAAEAREKNPHNGRLSSRLGEILARVK